jgi:hypothetical protein
MKQLAQWFVVLTVSGGCGGHDHDNVTSADAPPGHASQGDGSQGDGSQGSDNPVLDAEIMADMNAAGVPGLATAFNPRSCGRCDRAFASAPATRSMVPVRA